MFRCYNPDALSLSGKLALSIINILLAVSAISRLIVPGTSVAFVIVFEGNIKDFATLVNNQLEGSSNYE